MSNTNKVETNIKYGYRLSPSSVSKFFSYNCDRFFVYNFFKEIKDIAETKETGVKAAELSADGFSAAAGNIWEDVIYKSLCNKAENEQLLCVHDCTAETLSKTTDPDELMNIFNRKKDDDRFLPQFLYQPSFNVNEDPFAGIQGKNIQQIKDKKEDYPYLLWSKIMPDFILFEKNEYKTSDQADSPDYIINIIDVKLARYPHLSHKMQVAFYALLMNQFMKEYCESDSNKNKPDDSRWEVCDESNHIFKAPLGALVQINMNKGFVLANRDEVTLAADMLLDFESVEDIKRNFFEFDLTELDAFIESFLEERVCGILKESAEFINSRKISSCSDPLHEVSDKAEFNKMKNELAEALNFCIGTNCDGCGVHSEDGKYVLNSKTCIELGEKENNVQLYPYMSRRAQLHIQEYAREHVEDYRICLEKTAKKGEEVSADERSLLSYKNINRYIDYLRSRTDSEECIEENEYKERLYEELKANYSWAKLASFNNFKYGIKKALDYRGNRLYRSESEKQDIIPSMISIEENEEYEKLQEYKREKGLNQDEENELKETPSFRKYSFNSMNIPSGQDVAVFMNVQTAIGEDGKEIVYAYNVRLHLEAFSNVDGIQPRMKVSNVGDLGIKSKRIDADSFDICEVAEVLDREHDLRRKFVDSLFDMIVKIDEYNKNKDDAGKLVLQAYVFDKNEEMKIRNLLQDYYISLFKERNTTDDNAEIKEIMDRIQMILFWLQGDAIIGLLDEQPDSVREVPVVVILDEIRKLFEIPAYVSINMWNVCMALSSDKGSTKDLEKFRTCSEKYCATFSDSINVKSVYAINEGRARVNDRTSFINYYTMRFDMEEEILDVIQHKYNSNKNSGDDEDEKEKIGLYNRVLPFALPKAKDINDVRLAKLIMLRSNEFYHDYCETKNIVMRSPASAIAAGKVIVASFDEEAASEIDKKTMQPKYGSETGRHILKMDINESMPYEKIYEGYLIHCVNLDTDGAGRDLLSRSLTYENLLNGGNVQGSGEVKCIKIENTSEAGDGEYITFTCKEEFKPRKKDKFLIIGKPSDYTTVMELNALVKVDGREGEDTRKILDPVTFYNSSIELRDNEDVSKVWTDEELIAQIESDTPTEYSMLNTSYNFEKAQWEAFKHLCKYNITLLQGPPGTGKTDYIGRSVITLSKIAMKYDKPFRVLVGGFTHASINNAVKKIYSMAKDAGLNESISFFKDKDDDKRGFQIKEIEDITDLNSSYLGTNKEEEIKKGINVGWRDSFNTAEDSEYSRITVHGSTCWQAFRTNPVFFDDEYKKKVKEFEKKDDSSNIDFSGFDLVIIDEASQLTVAQALMIMSYGKTYKTHFLIVGDNHQLPPIIRGDYKGRDLDYNIHSSIFDFFMSENHKLTTGDRNYLYSLNTEFRMNEALCNYSAKCIYNPQDDYVRTGKKYTAYCENNATFVKSQKLRYSVGNTNDIDERDWVKAVMDPDMPLVTIYLDGKVPERVRKAEIEIVSLLKDKFEKHMVNEKDNSLFFTNDKPFTLSLYHFWGGTISDKNKDYCRGLYDNDDSKLFVDPFAFGIVTPYNRQKELLFRKISTEYLKNSEYQDVCITSYGKGGFQSSKFDYEGQDRSPVYGLTADEQEAIRTNENHVTEIRGEYYIYKEFPNDRNQVYKKKGTDKHEIRKYKERPGIPRNKLLIDTVNRLQGQERETIIVSYGLYDPEMAIAQGEFIYNYQRLNVALTRGKKKTILIFSNALSDKPIEMLDTNDDELIKGVSFMCDLKKYMKTEDETFKISSWKSDGRSEEWPGKEEGISVEIYTKGLKN